jgi:phosphatidylserine decarboxylase
MTATTRVFHRRTGTWVDEPVYGADFFRWCYTHPFGKWMLENFLSNRPLNQLYGLYQRSPWSKSKIQKDIDQFQIDLKDFEKKDYKNYDEFFLRRYLPEKHPFGVNPETLYSPAEGNTLGYRSVSRETAFPIKGQSIELPTLLGNEKWANVFMNGPALIVRLTPTDYHWYHYPTFGRTVDHYSIPGKFYSVSRYAIELKPDCFLKNERRVSILETAVLGKIAFIEIGAICVGQIIQTHPGEKPFEPGTEKGHFSYGASTIVVLGEADRWSPDESLVTLTAEGFESRVSIGEPVACAES